VTLERGTPLATLPEHDTPELEVVNDATSASACLTGIEWFLVFV